MGAGIPASCSLLPCARAGGRAGGCREPAETGSGAHGDGGRDNLDKARQEAARILKQDSRHGKAIQLLAEIVPNEEAIKAEEAAIKTRNADKAIDNVTKERVEKARKALDETRAALKRFPDKETAAFHLAKTHFAIRQRDLASAMKEVKSALEADPKSVDAHILRGRLLFAETAKATDAEATKAEATKEFKTAADLSPPRSTAKLRYAEFLIQQGSSDQARTFLKEVTQKAPDYVAAWNILARLDLREKKLDDAMKSIDNTLRIDPENPDARLGMGEILIAKGEAANALETLLHLERDAALWLPLAIPTRSRAPSQQRLTEGNRRAEQGRRRQSRLC